MINHIVPCDKHGVLPSVSAQVIGGEEAEISVKGVVSVQVKAILSYVLLGPGKVLAPLLCKKHYDVQDWRQETLKRIDHVVL